MQDYGFSYGYNQASQMTSQTYPSGRVINSSYDDAGRLSNVQRQGAEWSYAKEFSYAAYGGAEQIRLGNGLLEQMSYNTRLQVTQIGLGPTLGDTSKLKLAYDYGTATANNGNVQTITITPGTGQPNLVQTYSYDALNRLQTAQETRNGAPKWQQQYGYDRYGNRRITAATVGINGQVLTFSESNNRITTGGYGYDAAGNLITDDGLSRTYDVENRMMSATGGSYSYDGEGRRVKKTANGVTTIFVYNAAGQLSAEYNNASPTPGGGTRYLTADHLGSTRLVTSGGRADVKARYDYLPFGEEIAAPVGGRVAGLPPNPPTGMGYNPSPDLLKQKFVGYERDSETGLDFAQARYYSNVQGRFTSVDPLQESAKLENPQSWNRYVYVLNNPLVYIDPTGELWIASGDANNPYRWVDECPQGGTCYEAVAAAVATGVVVYGSQNDRDLTLYASNENGVVFATGIARHRDARFDSAAGQQRNPEHYLSPQAAAALFNAARVYADAYPDDADIVFTYGSAATGNAALNAQGEPIHRGHRNGANIDMRYMGANGRPLVGETASANADVNRMDTLFDAFADQNAGLGAALTGTPERFGFGPLAAGTRAVHQNHFHLQRNYPRPPQPARRRR